MVEKSGVYLGEDLGFSRRKGGIFRRALERIGCRLASWKKNFLTFAGRVTFVKHVLSTIPIYLFSVFKAPNCFISKVQSIVVKFLWGKGDGSGIPWMKWANLCKPMGQGGMGLRDLGCFNQALLAKVAWRLFSNPESLLARVLMGKYCKEGDFFMAKARSGCSWGWRSILWEVGNGQDIKVFKDE